MKSAGTAIVSVHFPDGTHGKFPLPKDAPMSDVFVKACKKHDVDQEAHELVSDPHAPRSVDLAALVDSFAKKEFFLRVREGAIPRERGSTVLASMFCGFCGLPLGEEFCREFNGSKFHEGCFKCSNCFTQMRVGDKVYTNPRNMHPMCESCWTTLRGVKTCLRCGESVRGQFVVSLPSGDRHVECFTCCMCGVPLVSDEVIEKDGEILCPSHRSLKPKAAEGKKVKRPKKVGYWRVGDECIARAGREKWVYGTITKIRNGTADVEYSGSTIPAVVSLTDLVVATKPAHVTDGHKELRRGKVVSQDVMSFVQRQDSMALFKLVEEVTQKQQQQQQPQQPQRASRAEPPRPAVKVAPVEKATPQPQQHEEKEEPVVLASSNAESVLRFRPGEQVLAFLDEEWMSGQVITGDSDVEDGPYYLILFEFSDGSIEEPIHERDIRRVPSYNVDDLCECRWVEDGVWYDAKVLEKLNDDMYVVEFTDFGNSQQCTVDFLRPRPGQECPTCHGPKKVENGECIFCFAKLEDVAKKEAPKQSVPRQPSTKSAQVPSATSKQDETLSDDVESLKSEVLQLREVVRSLTFENQSLRKQLETTLPDVAELQELRERLDEALMARSRAESELETFKEAQDKDRLRKSLKNVRNNTGSTAKPLPAPPSRGRRIVKESSATALTKE